MQVNAIECAHCGKRFVRITAQTPLVNRSDGKSFHVTLFAGPDPRPNGSGDFYDGQFVCDFVYAHDRFGPKNHTVIVVLTVVNEDPEQVLRQAEGAADKLAELISDGQKVEAVYTQVDAKILPGLPK